MGCRGVIRGLVIAFILVECFTIFALSDAGAVWKTSSGLEVLIAFGLPLGYLAWDFLSSRAEKASIKIREEKAKKDSTEMPIHAIEKAEKIDDILKKYGDH